MRLRRCCASWCWGAVWGVSCAYEINTHKRAAPWAGKEKGQSVLKESEVKCSSPDESQVNDMYNVGILLVLEFYNYNLETRPGVLDLCLFWSLSQSSSVLVDFVNEKVNNKTA
jgi:hypothetical protein